MPEASPAATFRGGFLVGISNPKLLDPPPPPSSRSSSTPSAPWLPQFALLVATFVAVELTFYMLVVYALERASPGGASGARRVAAAPEPGRAARSSRAWASPCCASSAVAAAIPHFDLTSSRLNS